METELELAWLGGIIDGEGSIGVFRHVQVRNGKRLETWRPIIAICNTNPLIIERSASILERHEVPSHVHARPHRNPNWKQVLDIQIVGLRQVAKAIPVLRPYVYGKAENLGLMDRFVQSRLQSLSMPRLGRPGGGSEMRPFTDDDLEMVAGLQRLNTLGPPMIKSAEEIV